MRILVVIEDAYRAGAFAECDLLPLSGLQHLVFCERQCALIHLEQSWKDNVLTLEGSNLHARTDEGAPRRERRGDLLVVRSLPLRSLRLGVVGRADVVEFHRKATHRASEGTAAPLPRAVSLPHLSGAWAPFPVEYKRGVPKANRCDEVQLCAQALCLEEMLTVRIDAGALFYGSIRRRHDVGFDRTLRQLTITAADRFHALMRDGVTPCAKRQAKCRRCSLLEICMPETVGSSRSASAWLANALLESESSSEE